MKDLNQTIRQFSEKIGNTPLEGFKLDNGRTLFAKLEWCNPYGSVKDRVALAMLKDLYVKSPGVFSSGHHEIIEYSGGNLGVALAYMCFELGIKLNLVLLDSVNQAMLELLSKLDVKLHLVDKNEGFFGVMQCAKKLARKNPYLIFLYQHKNSASRNIHYEVTGVEITKQINEVSNDKEFGFVANIGTGSTLIGNYLSLKESYAIKLYATSPAEMPYGTYLKPYAIKKFAGSGGLGYGLKQYFVSGYDDKIVKHYHISLDQCYKAIKVFEKKYGIIIGTSSAANYLAAIDISNKTNLNVISIFSDTLSNDEKLHLNNSK